MRAARWLVLLALATVAGCFPQEPPPEPVETLVVYSLDPWVLLPGDEQDLEAGQAVFQRHIVLGSVLVTDQSVQREILDGVAKGIEEGKKIAPADRLACSFQPRHGLHHVAKDGTVSDWLICFSCGQVKEIRNGEVVKRERSYGKDATLMSSIQDFAGGPRGLLDETLRAAVKLAD